MSVFPLHGTPELASWLKTFKERLGMSDALPLPGTSGLVSRLKTFRKLLKRSYFFLCGAEGWCRAQMSVVTASSGEGSSRHGHGTPCCSAPSALWSWGTSAKGEHTFHCSHLQLLTGLHLLAVTHAVWMSPMLFKCVHDEQNHSQSRTQTALILSAFFVFILFSLPKLRPGPRGKHKIQNMPVSLCFSYTGIYAVEAAAFGITTLKCSNVPCGQSKVKYIWL